MTNAIYGCSGLTMAMALTILLIHSRRPCWFFRRHPHRIVSATTKSQLLRLFYFDNIENVRGGALLSKTWLQKCHWFCPILVELLVLREKKVLSARFLGFRKVFRARCYGLGIEFLMRFWIWGLKVLTARFQIVATDFRARLISWRFLFQNAIFDKI